MMLKDSFSRLTLFSSNKITTLAASTASIGPVPNDSLPQVPTTGSSNCSYAPIWNRTDTISFLKWLCRVTRPSLGLCASILPTIWSYCLAVRSIKMSKCGTVRLESTLQIWVGMKGTFTVSRWQLMALLLSVWVQTRKSCFSTSDARKLSAKSMPAIILKCMTLHYLISSNNLWKEGASVVLEIKIVTIWWLAAHHRTMSLATLWMALLPLDTVMGPFPSGICTCSSASPIKSFTLKKSEVSHTLWTDTSLPVQVMTHKYTSAIQ